MNKKQFHQEINTVSALSNVVQDTVGRDSGIVKQKLTMMNEVKVFSSSNFGVSRIITIAH